MTTLMNLIDVDRWTHLFGSVRSRRTPVRFMVQTVAVVAIGASSPALAEPNYKVVKDEHNVWWFEGPGGARFYSLGISNVSPEPFRPREGTKFYNPVPGEFGGSVEKWGASVRSLLLENHFNTLGAWSSNSVPMDERLCTTPVLYLVQHEGTRCLTPLRKDFEQFVRENSREAIAKLPDHKHILGVFIDNEMPWYGKSGWDDIPTFTLLEQAFQLPASDERRIGALEFLKSRYASVKDFNQAWSLDISSWEALDEPTLRTRNTPTTEADRGAFSAMLAERFYEVTTRVIREILPDTLILGTRIPGNAPDGVIRACGKYCDVMSVNEYRAEPSASVSTLTRFWVLGGKPIMHTEFSWRAKQNASGDPNTRGAGAVVETQAQRAQAYAGLVSDTATVPYVIGSHWFEFADQSPQGRFDGEDSNYGVVSIDNKPYGELLSAMRETNARVQELHAKTKRVMPSELPKVVGVRYVPGQHPERPASLDLLGEWMNTPELWGASDAHMHWKREGSTLVLNYDAGAEYGCGINIFAPKTAALGHGPKFAADLDGYEKFVIECEAPKGLQINLVLAEAGAAPPSEPKLDLSAGDDGEAFVSAPVTGTGTRTKFEVPIAKLSRQKFFGSQTGGSVVQMQAIRNVGLQVSGVPAKGEVKVYRFALER